MAQWTMTDNANGAPSWANTTLNLAKNRNELFGNMLKMLTAENKVL